MIEIDGRAGGGQMLRTALSLSAAKNRAFRMENIRGKRPNPGLKRQHLEAVKAVKRLCNADVKGDEQGSETLEFRPGKLEQQDFTVNIGTAGSITLLLDTVLPLTTQFNSGFRIDVKGGTDVKWSPPFSYFKHVKLELLEKFGFHGNAELVKTGYYPSGGGEAELKTEPYSLEPVVVEDRGELQGFEIYSKASEELSSQEVADRQASEAARILKNSHISVPVQKNVSYEKTESTGSSLLVKAVYENSVAGFDALGEKGRRSEKVAKEAVQDFKAFHSTSAGVDSRMADQLMVVMAITGGSLRVPELTDHVKSNASVIEKFGARVDMSRRKGFCSIVIDPN